MADHEHSAPDYYGRCEGCGMRLESPSRWMRDEAARIGGTIVSMTKTYNITDLLKRLPPPPS
jgi:hypothetical protein